MTNYLTAGPGIEAILRLAERCGASNVRVFGSVARGEARLDSDEVAIISGTCWRIGMKYKPSRLTGVRPSCLTVRRSWPSFALMR